MPKPVPSRQTREVLGIPIDLVDYDSAVDRLLGLTRLDHPVSATASNTHLVAQARVDPSFATVLRHMQLVLPDGMPLVWSLRAKGAPMQDRVYGPYFMERVITHGPAELRHYFFGGSDECLQQLRARLLEKRPDLQITGLCSPPFRAWTETDLEGFARDINRANPDVVWVALGGERQERWIHDNLGRFERGVFIGIGDAFELLAGRRPFAPAWIQKAGLTWAYRLWQEPRRLWKRYRLLLAQCLTRRGLRLAGRANTGARPSAKGRGLTAAWGERSGAPGNSVNAKGLKARFILRTDPLSVVADELGLQP